MATKNSIPLTQERLRELFHYDEATGIFTRLTSVSSNTMAGDIVGYVSKEGYRRIKCDGKMYRAHRLAWLYVHGRWPKDEIDHIDGNKSNNQLSNIRETTHSENMQNQRKARIDNVSSGLLGVTWHKNAKKWVALIKAGKNKYHLGCFDTQSDAHSAYLAAKAIYHPFSTITYPYEHPDTLKVPRPEGHDSWSIEIKTSYGGGGGVGAKVGNYVGGGGGGSYPDTGETTSSESNSPT